MAIKTAKQTSRRGVLDPVQSLLQSSGSLTQRLELLSGKPLKVVITHQGLGRLTHAQQRLFAVGRNPRQTLAWIRKSTLFGDEAWIQATTLMPISELCGNAKRLPKLGTTPIGYVLFKKKQQLPCARTYLKIESLPARQSLYDWQGRQLLIEEVFLPPLSQRLWQDRPPHSI